MSNIFLYRTDALLVKLSLLMGKEVFYGALWGSVLVSPSIRLPASLFVVSHINRELSGKQQKYMLGTDYKLTVSSSRSLWNSLIYHNASMLACCVPSLCCIRMAHSLSQRKKAERSTLQNRLIRFLHVTIVSEMYPRISHTDFVYSAECKSTEVSVLFDNQYCIRP